MKYLWDSLLCLGYVIISTAALKIYSVKETEPGCRADLTTDQGVKTIDLNKLVDFNKPNKPRYNITGEGGNQFYLWNPCIPFSIEDANKDCEKILFGHTINSDCTPQGSEAHFFVENYALDLHVYDAKDVHHSVFISLVCGDRDGRLFCDDDDGCTGVQKKARFKFESRYVCLEEPHKESTYTQLSPGSIILLSAFSVMCVYFAFGIICGKRRGARGLNTLPHSDFWMELPALVMDGIKFVLRGCRPPGVRYSRVIEDTNVPVVDL